MRTSPSNDLDNRPGRDRKTFFGSARARRLLALAVLAGLMAAPACSAYRTRKVVLPEDRSRAAVVPRGLEIVRLMKTSGELVWYPDREPALIQAGVVSHPKMAAIPLSDVGVVWVRERDEGRGFALTVAAAALGVGLGIFALQTILVASI